MLADGRGGLPGLHDPRRAGRDALRRPRAGRAGPGTRECQRVWARPGGRRTSTPEVSRSGQVDGALALAVGRDVEPVAAGAGVAVALGAVAGEVDEHLVAVGGLAPAQPLAFAGGDDVGEGHPAVDREVLGQRGAGREVVHVPVVAVVVGQPRGDRGLGDQGVHRRAAAERSSVASKTAADRRRAAPARPRRSSLGQLADLADVVRGPRTPQRRRGRSAAPRSPDRGRRVDQVDDARERVLGVVTEQHRGPLGRSANGSESMRRVVGPPSQP